MSSGQIALNSIGIKYTKYYASEIDKYAKHEAIRNYPNTIQLGDILRWREWDIDFSTIDLVMGGFPCQTWSMAGNQMGDKDPRGKLFWTMLEVMARVLKENPNAKFLIENVKMKKSFEQYITYHTKQALGDVYKHLINSSLVSAQNRERYYWTNIKGVEQPKDKGLVVKDILEDDAKFSKDYPNYLNGKYGGKTRISRLVNIDKEGMKARCLTATMYKGQISSFCINDKGEVHKYTPLECERLQNVPSGYTEGVSNTQRYKMLGNGWTVDVISHILSYI